MFLLLNKEKLLTLEKALRNYLPAAIKTYGTVLNINRGKISDLEVVVDSWPDFSTVLCQPCEKEKTSNLTDRTITVFSKDQGSLCNLLMDDNVVNWATCFVLGGIDISFLELVKDVAACKKFTVGISNRVFAMILEDPKDLHDITPERKEGRKGEEVNQNGEQSFNIHVLLLATGADVASRISHLLPSHAQIVNRNWKFGKDENGLRFVKTIIANFPSYCILDETGNPVSWLLTYQYCAMGLLYTLPEHRRKGYAKLLVTKMVKTLQKLGYPIYCFIEEENGKSYQLFEKLGFKKAPDICFSWPLCRPIEK
ncbi:glycine N-acyltransferase-like protein 3 isoform X1 [Carcharodon carcharias]|uniref:glycine N-acyltransferase-like protein 3 isoform X1 n=1 Tax=Carcharodon carcharias TaxID=13397 RepID=UPI001B7F6EFE|nr:glycine N-acyltransferase-like protein 3 isoform X1 [Carcharodon carcharias]